VSSAGEMAKAGGAEHRRSRATAPASATAVANG
jgi:hypothetical protein